VGWAFFYMFVVLKIPIIALGIIIWKAVHDVPEPTGGDGERDYRPRRHPRHPRPRHPRLPRRGGPHAAPVPAPPQRIRARGKRVERTHG
jgi:hypothetical protein